MSAVPELRRTAGGGMPRRIAPPPQGLVVSGLHLAVLWAFALVQPLFDLLGRNAQFFAARGNTAGDILIFALGFTLVPPALLLALEWLIGRVRPSASWLLHLLFVGLLVALLALPLTGDVLPAGAAVVAAALVGGGAALLYTRARGIRSFMTVLSPAPALFLFLFLVTSPASKLVFPSDASAEVAGPIHSRTPVVFIVFDELASTTITDENGRIDRQRFRNLARLGLDATWYRDATTVADGTTEAVPAMLTGNLAHPDELPTDADHPRNLFTLLGRSHEMHVIEPVTDICPDRLCGDSRPGAAIRLRSLAADLRVVSLHLLLPEGMRNSLPAIDRNWQGFGDEVSAPPRTNQDIQRRRLSFLRETAQREGTTDPVGDFNQTIASIRRGGSRPALTFLHVELPHVPWRFLPDGRQYLVHRNSYAGLESEHWTGGQWLADQGFQRHMLQMQYADRLIGRLLDRLQATGQYDKSLIVMTADHGVSFRNDDGRRAIGEANFADIAGMPLFIKAPRQRSGKIDDSLVRTIDILPTVARELGTPLPWRVDGVPAGERSVDPETRIAVSHVGAEATSMPFGRFLDQRAERNRYEQRLIGRALYAIGPRPEFVGRRLDELDVTEAGGGPGVQLDGTAELAAVAPDSGVVPAYISGTVSGLAPGDDVAVAVNGRIETTTRVRREGDALVFAAMVPPSSLRSGSNAVNVLRFLGGGGLQVLGGLKGEAPYRLVGTDGDQALVRGRERIPVERTAVTGYVDGATVQGPVLGITGWAAMPDLSRPADRIVAVAGARQLASQRPGVVREDLGKWMAPLRTAGYQFTLPLPAIESADGRLQVFGIANGRATPLEQLGNVPKTLDSLR